MTAPLPARCQVGGLEVSSPLPWLTVNDDVVGALVAHEAHATLGIREWPLGSNRGPEVDRWLRDAGVPESTIQAGKGYWCAAWAGAMWRAAGVVPPSGYADCDVLWRWARQTGRLSMTPALGALVLYGTQTPPDAKHVGIVIDVRRPVMTIEANTTVEGSTFERNGTAVALKLIEPNDQVLGYVHIHPAATP